MAEKSSKTPRAKKRRPRPMKDVAVVVGRTDDQRGYQVLRKREDEPPQLGELRPLEEGKPIEGEVVGLRARKDVPFVYDVNVAFDARQQSGGKRPPIVASDDYRRGWDAIWGKQRVGKNESKGEAPLPPATGDGRLN